jgi:hypothetical protein
MWRLASRTIHFEVATGQVLSEQHQEAAGSPRWPSIRRGLNRRAVRSCPGVGIPPGDGSAEAAYLN